MIGGLKRQVDAADGHDLEAEQSFLDRRMLALIGDAAEDLAQDEIADQEIGSSLAVALRRCHFALSNRSTPR